ncbi:Heparinase II/III-like protein [Glycomyces sambucus]|uniref:Heparinase II/III-like protein n=1 Tax=Glycomyces sambucus TaxID=380244 RepID=A0A1G9LBN8_9ACTN|nr:heparinase II/III family protein [Glycomyces sambucus]SDL59381.1 Heparinase II/III-like protein [Glycomyces sambucus]
MHDLRTALLEELREIAARPVPDFDPALADDFAATGRRLPYEAQYFARRRHLAALAITGEAAPLSSLLKDVCQERSWALPAHWGEDFDPRTCVDLFACETAQTLAEILRLREDVEGREQVEAEIRERVLDPFFESEFPFWWELRISNWTAVCAGAAGLAALALGYDTDVVRARVLPALQSYLFSFGPDGGCVEGVYYWIYGFGYFTYFAEAWREATGEDLLEGNEAIAAFPARAQLYPGSFATFGDTDGDPLLPAGLLTRLHDRLGAEPPAASRPQTFAEDECARWAPLTRTLEWGRPLPESVEPARTLLPEVGWFVERRRIGRRMWALAVKGGYNEEPHNHLDLGAFIIAVDGEQLLCDAGAGEYTAAYFGEERYEQVHPSAAWHSVPTVEGAAQQPGEDSRAELVDGPDGVEVYVDAYGDGALIRKFAWKDERIILRDFGPELTETFVSRIRPELEGDRAVWTGERGTLILHGINPEDALVDSVDTADHRGFHDRLWALRFGLPAESARLRFELL